MTSLLHRPEPILRQSAKAVDRTTPRLAAAEHLRDGGELIVADRYSTGVRVLTLLGELLRPPREDASFEVRQDFKRSHRAASMRLLAPISGHRVALEGAGHIGFLAELYPDQPDFILPFVQVQELNGAWERFDEGLHLSVLGHRVHPFFGTYVPTRVEHLELFATWLSQHGGPRARAIDVGTGCGVLALMLCKASFQQVLATDSNANAIESVRRELARLPVRPPIELFHGDLLGPSTEPVDLIVFNPPWTEGTPDGLIAGALVSEAGLLGRFFDQAVDRLSEEGRVVVVFSNLMGLVQPDLPHPILTELERGRFHLVNKLQRKVKPPANKEGKRRWTREKVEVWELAKNSDAAKIGSR
jgi:precorrin-6B methylase 2